MPGFADKNEVITYRLPAVNFARESPNRIHNDEVARAYGFKGGLVPGTLDFHLEFDEHGSKVRDHYLDSLAVYGGPEAIYHPAYLLEQANQILMQNVDLGPWIHTRSEVQNSSLPRVHNRLSIRGHVARSYEKRGNELVDLDLAIFDSEDRGIAKIKHTAIVRLGEGST